MSRLLVASLLLLSACASQPKAKTVDMKPGETASNGVANGEFIEVTGRAVDISGKTVVETSNGTRYYLEEFSPWPNAQLNKTVVVEGDFFVRAGSKKVGISGTYYVLANPRVLRVIE